MTALVFCVSSDLIPGRLKEFRKRAAMLADFWDCDVLPVGDGGEVLNCIQATTGPIDRLAICCHGWTDHIMHRWSGIHATLSAPPRWISVADLVAVLGPRAAPNIHVALCCCNAGSNRGKSRWSWRSYGDGGNWSFASVLYANLSQWAPGCSVVAHATAGNTTENLAKRGWGARYSGEGRSLLDLYLPPGQDDRPGWFRLPRNRRQWKAVLRAVDADGRSGALHLMAGSVPPWMP